MWETKAQKLEKQKELERQAKIQAIDDALVQFGTMTGAGVLLGQLRQRLSDLGREMRQCVGRSEVVGYAAAYTELEDTIKWLSKKMK